MTRRVVVQRCPAVPTAPKKIAAHGEIEIRAWRHDHGVVAAEFQQRPSQPPLDCLADLLRPCAQEPVAEISGTRRRRQAVRPTVLAIADDQREDRRIDAGFATHLVGDARDRDRARAAFYSDGFQTTGSPHTQASAAVPRPHRDGKIERRDHADRRRADAIVPSNDAADAPMRWSIRAAAAKARPRSRRCRSSPALRLRLGDDLARLQGDQLGEIAFRARGARCRVGAPFRRGPAPARCAISGMPRAPARRPVRNLPRWLCGRWRSTRPSMGDTCSITAPPPSHAPQNTPGFRPFRSRASGAQEFMHAFFRGAARNRRHCSRQQWSSQHLNAFHASWKVQHRPKANGSFATADRQQARFEKPFVKLLPRLRDPAGQTRGSGRGRGPL